MTTKAKHPNSLKNLIPGGNNKGRKKRVTKNLIENLTAYLEKDLPNFIAQIESLPKRDQVQAKMKLMDMIVPKKREVDTTNTVETVDWSIQIASQALPPAAIPPIEIQEGEVVEIEK